MSRFPRRSRNSSSRPSVAGRRAARSRDVTRGTPCGTELQAAAWVAGNGSRPREVSLRIGLRLIGTIGFATLMLGMAGGTYAASDVTGHVYVNDNTAGNNTIAGFDRHADGSLTPIAGSPFGAGGQGTGTVVGSQGALQLSGDGRYLLAADAGSNQISVLRIRPDGTLARVQGSPVYSGGFEPVSIAAHGHLVYVTNEGSKVTGTGSNYTGFTLNAGGHLTPLSRSTISLPGTAHPRHILFNSTATSLIGD